MKDVTVVVMSLPDCSPDRPADCPRLDFPVNEMSSKQTRKRQRSAFARREWPNHVHQTLECRCRQEQWLFAYLIDL